MSIGRPAKSHAMDSGIGNTAGIGEGRNGSDEQKQKLMLKRHSHSRVSSHVLRCWEASFGRPERTHVFAVRSPGVPEWMKAVVSITQCNSLTSCRMTHLPRSSTVRYLNYSGWKWRGCGLGAAETICSGAVSASAGDLAHRWQHPTSQGHILRPGTVAGGGGGAAPISRIEAVVGDATRGLRCIPGNGLAWRNNNKREEDSWVINWFQFNRNIMDCSWVLSSAMIPKRSRQDLQFIYLHRQI